MLWLAGLMGVIAVGSVAAAGIGFPSENDDEDATPHPDGMNLDTGLPEHISEGSDADDILSGDGSDNPMHGRAGDDTVSGDDGRDSVLGGEGDDFVQGGAGDDSVSGNDGDDSLTGGTGDDTLLGGAGRDYIDGGDGADEAHGGLGNDTLLGDGGNDALLGREGNDVLSGGTGQDTLFGSWGADTLSGVELDEQGTDIDEGDYLNGGEGNDRLIAGQDDTLSGGEGADEFVLGKWVAQASAEITDFDARDDRIVILYNDSGSSEDEPRVDLRLSEADPDIAEILVDGTVVATMPAAQSPEIEDIVLMAESAAAFLAE